MLQGKDDSGALRILMEILEDFFGFQWLIKEFP
jgi:hypothetical protein